MKALLAVLAVFLLCGVAVPARAETSGKNLFGVYVTYDHDGDVSTAANGVGPGKSVLIYHGDTGSLYTKLYTDYASIAFTELEEGRSYDIYVYCGFTEDGDKLQIHRFIQFWPIGVVEWKCERAPALHLHLPQLSRSAN